MRNSESSNPCPSTHAIFMGSPRREPQGEEGARCAEVWKRIALPEVAGALAACRTPVVLAGHRTSPRPPMEQVRRLGGWAGMAQVLAVVNQKGGVGKTTTAVNLGASLAAQEKRVLVVDLDPQGNATSGLGVEREPGDRPTVYQALLGEAAARVAALPTEVPHLFLLPAGTDLVGAELELVGMEAREQRLR